MKKNLALLLAAILLLTSVLGLTSAAETEAQAAQAPSQEIAFFNVSVKVGARLLFAVPADGYDVSPVDGSVKNLELLVWEEGASNGFYNRLDAEKNGAILKSQGTQKIGDKRYIVFSYNGLSASEMSKVVYARVLTTDSTGFRSYGDVYDYSVAEFANGYLNKESSAHKGLVEAMMDYGHFAADYKGISSYTAEEVKALKKVTVKAMANDAELFTQTTQLVSAGAEVTLAAPHFDGYALSSWGEGVTDGKITVNDDVELVANYAPVIKEHYTLDWSKATPGAYQMTGKITSGTVPGAFITGDAWEYAHGKVSVDEQNGINCIKYAHNGTFQVNFNKNFLGTSAGDTRDFSFQIKIKAAADGTFPHTNVNFYRLAWNDSTGKAANATPQNLLVLDTNGDIILRDYNGKHVVLGKGDAAKFQTVTVVCDVSENKFIGYIDGVKCGETTMALNPAALYHSLDGGKNTSLYLCLYGGYQAEDWPALGFPAKLVEDNYFRFSENSSGAYILDKDTGLYRKYDSKSAADKADYVNAQRYDLSYTVDDTFKTAIQEYVENNLYFYYTDAKVWIGDIMAQ